MEETKKRDNLTDKIVNFLYSKSDTKYIILLFIIGLILRFITALRTNAYPDELGYIAHAINFINSGKLQIHDQDGLWFFITDFFIKIFGSNFIGARFFAILFGALSIILVYLIAKEIFNKKAALMSAIILTISSYSLIMTVGQMDIPMAFFAFLGIYFLILFLKTDKQKFFILTWVSLGLAIMIKQIALLFIPAFVLFLLYYNKKTHGTFRLKQIIYAAIIIILMVTPVLTYNYLLYKDKGLVDMQFSRFFGIAEEHYASIAPTLRKFSFNYMLFSQGENGEIPSGLMKAFYAFLKFGSLFILIFAVIGIFYLACSKNKFKWLLFLSFLFPFLFLAGTSPLSNHFSFWTLFFALMAPIGIYKLAAKTNNLQFRKWFIIISILLILIGSLYSVYNFNKGFIGTNPMHKLISYKEENIKENSIVIVDSRIYRGIIAYSFWNRHYLESSYFPELVEKQKDFTGTEVQSNIYFIEAVPDDIGWGTIKNQQEFNQTQEIIVDYFKQNTQLIKTIDCIDGSPCYNVYYSEFKFKPSVFEYADFTHDFFFYPVAYERPSFDDYTTYNAFDTLLNAIAHYILYLEAALVFILSVIMVLFLIKDKEKQ